MTHDWQRELQARSRTSATSSPPPAVEETEWDILLALRADRHCRLSLEKLGQIVSAPQSVIYRWLERLEERGLITGVEHGCAKELRAALTPSGRSLLDRYLAAASDLQVGAHH